MSQDKKRVRAWCFTLNNHTKAERKAIRQIEARYIVYGKETAPTTGTPHLQGYIYFNEGKTLRCVKKMIPRAKLIAANGTGKQNRKYCTKDGDFFEKGELPNQGRRVDLEDLAARIMSGEKVDDLTVENPVTYHQYGRTMNRLEDIYLSKQYRTEMTKGIWLYGPSDVGKTHIAMQGYTPETHYVHPVHDKGWWDNYRQQHTVIINDFRGAIPYNELLQLVDKWPHNVPRRGRPPIPFTSKIVYITSPCKPEEVYYNLAQNDSLDQLYRRFEVREILPHNK